MQKNKQMQKNKRQNVKNVRSVIRQTVTGYAGLSLGILLAVAGAIVTALLPPWILGSIVDTITAGNTVPVALVILYFAFTVLTGLTESLREGLLTVFGQKITHALRSSMMEKYTNLTAGELTKQEPGTIVSRFVGDVDTVENLFTSGIGYLKVLFNTEVLPQEDLPYAGLLKSILGSISTEHYSYSDLTSEIHLNSGGVDFSVTSYPDLADPERFTGAFVASIRVLYDKLDFGFTILEEILNHSVFTDEKRLGEVIQETRSRAKMKLENAGHSTAVSRATSYFSATAYYNELTGGTAYYHFLEQLEKLNADKETKEKIRKEIMRFKAMPGGSQEANVLRTYIETVLELPWKKTSRDNQDIRHAEKILEEDHYGLEQVKERVLKSEAKRS